MNQELSIDKNKAPDQILKDIVDGIKRERISEDALEWMEQFEYFLDNNKDGDGDKKYYSKVK
jgi:hypothetical protein